MSELISKICLKLQFSIFNVGEFSVDSTSELQSYRSDFIISGKLRLVISPLTALKFIEDLCLKWQRSILIKIGFFCSSFNVMQIATYLIKRAIVNSHQILELFLIFSFQEAL